MDGEEDVTLSPDEFVEYCETQAGLLMGSVETMATEADELLDSIDDAVAEVRSTLEEEETSVGQSDGPRAPEERTDIDAATVDELEADVSETQAVIEAKRARIVAFRELARGYTTLAAELRSDVDDGNEALERVVQFEAENDAPTYFDDRTTVYEAATSDNGH